MLVQKAIATLVIIGQCEAALSGTPPTKALSTDGDLEGEISGSKLFAQASTRDEPVWAIGLYFITQSIWEALFMLTCEASLSEHINHNPASKGYYWEVTGEEEHSTKSGKPYSVDVFADGESMTVTVMADTSHGAGEEAIFKLFHKGELEEGSHGKLIATPCAALDRMKEVEEEQEDKPEPQRNFPIT